MGSIPSKAAEHEYRVGISLTLTDPRTRLLPRPSAGMSAADNEYRLIDLFSSTQYVAERRAFGPRGHAVLRVKRKSSARAGNRLDVERVPMRWCRSKKPAKSAASIFSVAAGCHPSRAKTNARG
jgi:hypothetical protein